MALFHVDVHCLSKGGGAGGGFAKYLCREVELPGTRHSQYLIRDGRDGSDLTACGYGALPAWARDGVHFFEMCDRFERSNATVARAFQVTLPRELDEQARLALAADIRTTFFEQFPHVWAVHTPLARDGKEQPHLHVQISERRDVDGHTRSPKEYFARAADATREAKEGGVRKDRSFIGHATLREFRYGVATLINAALEREGIAAAISAKSLQERGHGREPEYDHTRKANRQRVGENKTPRETWQETLEKRNLRQRDIADWENLVNLEAWRQQKLREGICDLSRSAIVDFTRDRFWRQDHSEARERERQESLLRAVAREYERADQARTTEEQERTKERTKARQWRSPFTRTSDDGMRQGVHVHFDRESA